MGIEPAMLAWESNAQPFSQLATHYLLVHKAIAIYYCSKWNFTDIKVKQNLSLIRVKQSMFRYIIGKNSDSDVLLFTRIRMQCWHTNSLGTVVSDTVPTVSLSAPGVLRPPNFHRHCDGWLPPNQHHHHGVLQCSRQSFLGTAFRKLLCSFSHLNATSFDPTWMHIESETLPALRHASASPLTNDRTAWTVLALYLVRPLRRSHVVQIGNNYLNDGHLPLERPWQNAIHHTQISRASIPCHSGRVWHLAVVVSFVTLRTGRPPTSPTTTTVGDVGGRPWQSARIWL